VRDDAPGREEFLRLDPRANRLQQRPRLRGRRDVQVERQPVRELLVLAHRVRPAADVIEQSQQPAERALIVASDLGGSPRPGQGSREVAAFLVLLR